MTLKFERALPSVVKSIRQRDLLNSWLRLEQEANRLPRFAQYQPNRITDELLDMVTLQVSRDADRDRFLVIDEGFSSQTSNSKNGQAVFLDTAMGPERYQVVLPYYQACLEHSRPIYAFAMVKDEDGKEVSYERLLLPFGESGTVDHIVGAYKTMSIEGGFKIKDFGKLNVGDSISITRAVIDT
jgi:hypothetical protein